MTSSAPLTVNEPRVEYGESPEVAVAPLRLTRAQYLRMHADELILAGRRTELVDGIIYEMAAQGSPHRIACSVLMQLFIQRLAGTFTMGSQQGVLLGEDSMPEPDVYVARGSLDTYRGSDIDFTEDRLALVIEVAESTVRKNRTLSLDLYARYGIPEYWIVNLRDKTVEQYTGPTATDTDDGVRGEYATRTIHRAGGDIATLELGTYAVDDVLP